MGKRLMAIACACSTWWERKRIERLRMIVWVFYRQPFGSGGAVQALIGREEGERRKVIGE